MRELTIRIQLPDDALVSVDTSGPSDSAPGPAVDEALVRSYWEFLTENSRMVFGALAAEQIESGGPVTFDAVADRLDIPLSEAQTYNQNAGRGARVWRDKHNGADPPIRPIAHGLAPGRRRKKTFRLPPGVAEIIVSFDR